WGSTIGAAAALGPLLGGWLAEHFSWRWAFGINVPLAVLIVIGVLLFLSVSPRNEGRIDVIGAVLSALGLGLLAFGLIEGRTYGWFTVTTPLHVFGLNWDSGPSPALVALVLALVTLLGFVRRQLVLTRSADAARALMDVRLFGISSFRNGNIATLILSLGETPTPSTANLSLNYCIEIIPPSVMWQASVGRLASVCDAGSRKAAAHAFRSAWWSWDGMRG